MELMFGETYSIQMRCALGDGEFTDWGPTCAFSIALDIDVDDFPNLSGILMIYPNPGDGEKIFFDFGNLPENMTVQDLALYGSSGNLIENLSYNLNPATNKIYEYYFKNKLASGMYILRYKLNGHESEEKLIVRSI